MPNKGVVFDEDVKRLVHLLLREHAKKNNDFNRYENISSRMSFEIANRGLRLLGFSSEAEAAPPEPKK